MDFVGGIVTDGDNRVLMVRRAEGVGHMAGLWSLPGGARRDGESDQQAVERKVRGETGLEVEVEAPVLKTNRRQWRGTAYRVRRVGGQVRHGLDAGIADCRFFAVDDLPERTVLEAGLAIMNHRLETSMTVNAHEYSSIIDRLFSALFFSYLEPALDKLELEDLATLSWSITNTPLRKFKSAIPFLLSDRSDRAKEYALMAEIVFAICTIMDDLCDDRTERYGFPTAHRHFGRPQTVAFIFGAIESLRRDLSMKYGDTYAESMAGTLLECARSQTRRFADEDLEISDYFDNCVKRNDFLGVAWSAGLRASGQHDAAEFIYALHRAAIPVSQMINDYYDMFRNEFRDFRAGVRSYCIRKLATELADRRELEHLLAGRADPAAERRFHELLERYDIIPKVRADIRVALGEVAGMIEDAPLSASQKTILACWNDIPLTNILDGGDAPGDFHAQTERFVDSLDSLCGELS
jgi:8-oxo-dGTP pyrophosphatase MutT (NUDIX family)/geranylgeranyl pyrophosphate synthase